MKQEEAGALLSIEAARLCRVSRGTINYWIKTKNLFAKRSSRGFSIPVDELVRFLKRNGYTLPPELANEVGRSNYYRRLQPCWEYYQTNAHDRNCENCVVSKMNIEPCFTTKFSVLNQCKGLCIQCAYYNEMYLPRIRFVDQFDLPAAIYKGLYFWIGNKRFAELCEIPQGEIIGMGVEHVVHPDSIELVINNARRREIGDPEAPRLYRVDFKNSKAAKLTVRLGVCTLNEPTGACFVTADRVAN